MKTSWQQVPIENVLDCLIDYRGKTPTKASSGVKLITAKVVKGGRIEDGNHEYIAESEYQTWMRRGLPKQWDILITTEAPLGEVAILRSAERIALAQRIILLRANGKVTNQKYLFYALRSPLVQARLQSRATGTTVLGIKQSELLRVEIPLPSLDAQRSIASVLSAYDDLIENNIRRIEILEEMARRLYEEWFVRFRFPGYEKVRMVRTEHDSIPFGWEVKTLGDVATITMGLSPKGESYNEDGLGTPLVNGPVEFDERFTKKTKWTTTPTKVCDEGDLVVCVRGSTTGKYVKSDGVYCLGRGVCGIRSTHQSFVDFLFMRELPALLGQTGGSTFPSWTGLQLKSHRISVPPRDLLIGFEEIVTPMTAAVLVYSRQIRNLRVTRDLLLPNLISGELDVSELPEPESAAA